ncbi:MAG: HDOD domain-containing protein [Terracidiphilus sp.]
MQTNTARRAETSNSPFVEYQPWLVDSSSDSPAIPVLAETLLRLDLEAQERSVDLRAMSDLVLSDLGATLQILRLAGTEYWDSEFRPTRVEDCISDLGVQACLEAVSAATVARDSSYKAVAETWAHSRGIAYHSRQIAEEMQEVNPDEAYMAGLLHAIGLLPTVLGWSTSNPATSDLALAGLKLARKWSLPPFLIKFLGEMHEVQSTSQLPQIVRQAHLRSVRSSIHCPMEIGIGPLLYRTL